MILILKDKGGHKDTKDARRSQRVHAELRFAAHGFNRGLKDKVRYKI